jgi:hypothetical protein
MTDDHSLLNAWACAHTALLVEGQSRLGAVIGTDSPAWELNPASGLMTLNSHPLQFALLGSVDEEQNTWQWSWADPSLDQDSVAVRRALPLKEFAQESGLWEFARPNFSMAGVLDLGMTPGSTLALVACPQILGSAIFSGWYPGGRIYTVVTDPSLALDAVSVFTVPKILSGALAYGLGDHHDIVAVYAGAHQLDIQEAGNEMTLVFGDGTKLLITFDEQGRLRKMHGVVTPEQWLR